MRLPMSVIGYALFLGFNCIAPKNGMGQGKTGNDHSFMVGVGMQVLTEERLGFSSRKISSTAFSYSFTHSNDYYKKSITVGFKGVLGNTTGSGLRSNAFILQYAHAFSMVKNRAKGWNNYTGYNILVNPKYMKSGEQYSWATINALSFYNSLQYSWKKAKMSLDISMPVVGLASRPEPTTIYKGSINDMLYNSFSNLVFTSFHNLEAINLSLQYQKGLTGKLHFQGEASFSYKQLSAESDFRELACYIGAGLIYQLK